MADGSDSTMRRYSISEIADALLRHKTVIAKRASGEHWPYDTVTCRGGQRRVYPLAGLPGEVQAALLLRERPAVVSATPTPASARSEAQIESLWARYERAPAGMRETAQRRAHALRAVAKLVESGTSLMQARAVVAAQMQRDGIRGASASAIGRWQKKVHGTARAHWLAVLLPAYAGRQREADMPAQSWDWYKADWLRVEQPSAASCYQRLQRIAEVRGWDLPCARTYQRRIERELPRAVRVLARQGEEAMMRMYPAQERDRSMFAAMEGVNADGHRWDVMVRFPDGEIGRPMILGWQDLYSGKLLAWRLCDHESSDAVRLSYSDMVRRYGVPAHAWLDNGRAFASKWMTGGARNRYRFKVREEDPEGVITGCGTEVHWVTPYHGQAKPIERAWRELADHIAKHPDFAGAYVGNNPMAKPENYGSRAIPWEQFAATVDAEIRAHNARVGRKTPTCAGRSYDETFAASYEHAVITKATEAQLRTLLLAAEAVTASRMDGSVRLAGNRYHCDALAEYAGRKVVLRVDPDHLHGSAHVYALDGSYIAEAPCIARVGFADTNAAREHARGRQQYKRGQKQMLEAERRMDVATMAAQLPTPPPETLPEAAVIAPVFRTHAKAAMAPLTETPKATGTDGVTTLDSYMTRLSAALRDDVI